MISLEKAKLYKEELEEFLGSSIHDYVKNIFKNEITKLNKYIESLDEKERKVPNISTSAIKILNYGWGQNDKYLELYVTLKNVQQLEKEDIITKYGPRSVEILIKLKDGKNHSLTINNLCEEISPELSKIKLKTDLLVVMLKKKIEGKNWPFVTENEKRIEQLKTSKFKSSGDNNDDPSKSLMDMMKKMYDEGDDEMKRTLQKCWHDSQEKQSKGLF